MRLIMLLPILLLAACGSAPEVHQGVVEFDEETLAFEVAGTVATVPVAEGARTEAGAVVATLEGEDLRLAVAEAEAQVALAERRLAATAAPTRAQELAAAVAEGEATRLVAANAGSELARQQRLFIDGLTPPVLVERAADAAAQASAQAKASVERLALLREGPRAEDIAVAEAAVSTARATAERARQRLALAELRAPGPRLVRHHHRRAGEAVQPGTPAITLADPDRPYVDAFVAQGRLAALRVGGLASVHVDGRTAVSGTIERIGERLEFTPRYLFGPEDRPDLVARVRVRLASGEGLHAGVPADVTFVP